MATAKTQTIQATATPQADQITLDEFCLRLSKVDKRVELIGAFHYAERAAEHVKDTESDFQARFEAFATKPV